MEEYNKLTKSLITFLGELEINKILTSKLNVKFIYITTPQLSLVFEHLICYY